MAGMTVDIKNFVAGSDYDFSSNFGFSNGSGYGNGSSIGAGSSSGFGCGYGYGDGSGRGDGDSGGYGFGCGSGSGYGYDDGCGSGFGEIANINGERVYMIDEVMTIIRHVRGNVAKGAVLKADLTTERCFVVKQGDVFAHGTTLRKAMEALTEKLIEGMSEDERISAFVGDHEWGKSYPNRDLYDWHHKLTGSCEMGRQTFAQERGIDLDGSMTVAEFITLTKDAYQGHVIRALEARYKEMIEWRKRTALTEKP